jgi:hypothetical protein
MIDSLAGVPDMLLVLAFLFVCASITALIFAGYHATSYQRKLLEFEEHMRLISGERDNVQRDH